MTEPGESSFDDPPTRQDYKTLLFFRAQNHCQDKLKINLYPIKQRAAIAAVHPNFAEFLATARKFPEQKPCSVTVLNFGNRAPSPPTASLKYQPEYVASCL
jgi:hypothetical protein